MPYSAKETLPLPIYVSQFLMGLQHWWTTSLGLRNVEFGGLEGRGRGHIVVFLCNICSFFANRTEFESGIKKGAELLVKEGPL